MVVVIASPGRANARPMTGSAKQPFMLRHCEPTGRANARPMTGSAKQSSLPLKERMDCFVARAPRNDVEGGSQ